MTACWRRLMYLYYNNIRFEKKATERFKKLFMTETESQGSDRTQKQHMNWIEFMVFDILTFILLILSFITPTCAMCNCISI